MGRPAREKRARTVGPGAHSRGPTVITARDDARVGHTLSSFVLRGAFAAALTFVGCAIAPRPSKDPAYCSSYDLVAAGFRAKRTH